MYQLVFLSPEALFSNETRRDMAPSPVHQENLVAMVIDEFYQRACRDFGKQRNKLHSALERKPFISYLTYFSFPPPPLFLRACAPRGKIRLTFETREEGGQGSYEMTLLRQAVQKLSPVHVYWIN